MTQTGETMISCAGSYTFVESAIEVSEYSAVSMLEHLPTAATSLNSNIGDYTIELPETLVGDWFYPLEATLDDSGEVLASFIVANDLSAVYRVDEGIEPTLIYGSAQPMMDAQIYSMADEGEVELVPVVDVVLGNGSILAVGEESWLEALMPWDLPCGFSELISSNPDVVSVDEQWNLTAVGVGEAVVSGVLTIDDGRLPFEITVMVDNSEILGAIDHFDGAE